MLIPKKVKYRKWHTMRKNAEKVGVATRGITVAFGSFALKATEGARIRSNQIEAARKVLSRTTGKTGKIWIRIFPDMPYTSKPAEVKLGKGKGDPYRFVAQVRPGSMLFELDGVPDKEARMFLVKSGAKLPIKTTVIVRD